MLGALAVGDPQHVAGLQDAGDVPCAGRDHEGRSRPGFHRSAGALLLEGHLQPPIEDDQDLVPLGMHLPVRPVGEEGVDAHQIGHVRRGLRQPLAEVRAGESLCTAIAGEGEIGLLQVEDGAHRSPPRAKVSPLAASISATESSLTFWAKFQT